MHCIDDFIQIARLFVLYHQLVLVDHEFLKTNMILIATTRGQEFLFIREAGVRSENDKTKASMEREWGGVSSRLGV